MRGLKKLFLTLCVVFSIGTVVLAAIGVLHVGSDDEKINVTIDKKDLKEKADGAVEKTKEAGTTLLQSTKKAIGNLRSGSNGEQAPETANPPQPQPQPQPQEGGR